MGYITTIYFPDDIKELLKNERNKSGLIAQLLREYYKHDRPLSPAEIDLKLKELQNQEIEKKALEEQKKELLQSEEEKKKQEEEKKEKLIEIFTDNFFEFFKVNIEQAKEIAKDYYVNREGSIFEFGKSKGYEVRED